MLPLPSGQAQVLRIIATVVGGMVLGGAAGWLIPRRTKLTISGKQAWMQSERCMLACVMPRVLHATLQVFTGMPVEALG